MSSPRLEISDSQGTRTYALDRDRTRLGRRSDNDVTIAHPDVSREHAEIVRDNGRFVLRNLRSRHGTFVNGRAIEEHELVHGDRVRLGPEDAPELVFAIGETAMQTTPVRPFVTPGSELRQVAMLLEALKVIGAGGVLEEVLALVLDSALEGTGAERGFIMLANAAGELEFKLARERGGKPLSGSEFGTSRKIPRQVFATGQTVVESDLVDSTNAGDHRGTIELGIRAALCVPLRLVRYTEGRERVSETPRLIGVLYLDSKRRTALLSPTTRTVLESLANEAAMAVENARLYREMAEKARLEHEMDIAARIQRALLPPRLSTSGAFDAAGASIPCRAIGGDFLEYVDLPGGRLGFALGDVSGKGPPAALLAAVVHGVFAYQSEDQEGPAKTLTRVNRALVRSIVESRFVTLAYAVLAPDGEVRTCNAGHDPLLLVRADGSLHELDKGGLPLGIFEEAIFEEDSAPMSPGDTLVFYSDGVTEAVSPSGAFFGKEGLLACLDGAHELSADDLLQRIVGAVNEFAAGQPPADDVTVLVVRYRG